MSYYFCRFLDESGAVRDDIPFVGVSEVGALRLAQFLFLFRNEPGSFELWQGSRRIYKKEQPPAAEAGDSVLTGRN